MFNFVAIVGTQFGDEGKGKIIDYLSKKFDYVVRYQGGDNAGHTINFENKKYVLKLIPSGIFQTKTIIAPGTVINPETLFLEIQNLGEFNEKLEDKLFISTHANIVFDFHIAWDKLCENLRGKQAIGCTYKGIGPCYSDKTARFGIRISDLFDFDELVEKLTVNLNTKNPVFEKNNLPIYDPKEVAEKYFELGKNLKPYLINYFQFINREIKKGKTFLFEGSQGILLDLDCGTYPFVTSSNVISSLSHGTNLPIQSFKKIIGIVKAYASRVGNGIFITEILDSELSDLIRKKGNEYGSVTKRPRRIGWLDLVLVKYSIMISGITEISLTLIDVLNGLKEIKVCVGYQDKNGNLLDVYLPSCKDYITPIFKTFSGWNDNYTNIKKYEDFSSECRKYMEFLEDYLNVKITFISYGNHRNFTLQKEI